MRPTEKLNTVEMPWHDWHVTHVRKCLASCAVSLVGTLDFCALQANSADNQLMLFFLSYACIKRWRRAYSFTLHHMSIIWTQSGLDFQGRMFHVTSSCGVHFCQIILKSLWLSQSYRRTLTTATELYQQFMQGSCVTLTLTQGVRCSGLYSSQITIFDLITALCA